MPKHSSAKKTMLSDSCHACPNNSNRRNLLGGLRAALIVYLAKSRSLFGYSAFVIAMCRCAPNRS